MRIVSTCIVGAALVGAAGLAESREGIALQGGLPGLPAPLRIERVDAKADTVVPKSKLPKREMPENICSVPLLPFRSQTFDRMPNGARPIPKWAIPLRDENRVKPPAPPCKAEKKLK